MTDAPKRLACFDLEGPLSPQDNAYEVMSLFKGGREIFEVLSLFDDMVTLEGRDNYEPGDTLKLIVPFLIHNRIGSEQIKAVSETAKIVDGAAELIEWLRERGWAVRIISTSYGQHAYTIGERIGVPPRDIACTDLPIDAFIERIAGQKTAFMQQQQAEILDFFPPDMEDSEMKEQLEYWYFSFLPNLDVGAAMQEVEVMGGARKLEAAERFAEELGLPMPAVAAVGDSITDYRMLGGVKEGDGLAVAFNSNAYALPYASVGLCSTSLLDLKPIFQAWEEGGLEPGRQAASACEAADWVDDIEDMEEVLMRHASCRSAVRGEASRLG